MDDLELELKRDFTDEALMNLEEAESAFMELEGSTEPRELLEKIFRLAHNLKGGSRAVGFGDVAEFTHELENLVLRGARLALIATAIEQHQKTIAVERSFLEPALRDHHAQFAVLR